MKTNNPFLFYSAEANTLFAKAARQENEALWLFNNKARVSFFMLESLCRLFDKGLEDPRFTHWHKAFKKLEDMLGEVDLYDTFIKEFSKHKKISPDCLYYLQSKREKTLKKFEKRIKKSGYLDNGFKSFTAEIREMHIRFDADLILKIEAAMKDELIKLSEFAAYNDYTYSELEDHVHELRRKLRWIGMYTQSLRGIIRLADDGNRYKWEKKYLTKKSLESKFNVFPKNSTFKKHIEFERKHFIALNWMVGELGILKDKGLNVELLAKAIRKTEHLVESAAVKKAMGILGIKQTEAYVIKKASILAREFFAVNKIIGNLLYTPPQKISLKKAPPKFKLQLTIRNRKV
ncbi:MAG: hypothetical protein ACXVPQ_11850 [Bacteroidia bacterium]